jgi:hypothetical protein
MRVLEESSSRFSNTNPTRTSLLLTLSMASLTGANGMTSTMAPMPCCAVTDTHTIAPLQVGDLGTKRFDDSNDLMARDQGKPRVAPFIVHELDVAPRDATVRDPHQDVMAADRPLV